MTDRVERFMSRTLKRASRVAICLLALALEMLYLAAAREKLPTLATSKKVFRRSSPSIKHSNTDRFFCGVAIRHTFLVPEKKFRHVSMRGLGQALISFPATS